LVGLRSEVELDRVVEEYKGRVEGTRSLLFGCCEGAMTRVLEDYGVW
jgi:hypothetical protein